LPARRRLAVPFDAPSWSLNRFTVGAFNTLYYAVHRDAERVVDYDTYFYPLDHVADWNRLYGRHGYQALFPREHSVVGLTRLLERLSASGRGSFLAVLKSTGPSNAAPLSFPFPGHTLALDLPAAGSEIGDLTRELDAVVLDHGGRLYLAKDAMMTAEGFAAMYPKLGQFQELKGRVDPDGKFVSCQARRVGIA
jgi:FAD/FMN-containing dehydrogenase